MEVFLGLILNLIINLSLNSHTLNHENFSPENFRNYVCYKTTEEIIIDGKLDEKSWKKAAFSELFTDIEGPKQPEPIHKTKVKILWDDNYLYIGAFLEEPHIWASYTERESVIFHENDFEIFIDPNGDTHNYYELEINALNTIWDLLLTKPYRDHGKAINSWDVVGMKSNVFLKGTINDPTDIDEYWSVEFALPWSSLKEYATENRKPNNGDQWRINFSRVQWQREIEDGQYKKRISTESGKTFPESNWVWSPQGVIAMHQPETWGYLQFSDFTVGTNKSTFIFNADEICKWELRKVYYDQKKYFKKNAKFLEDPASPAFSIQNCLDPSFVLKANQYGFEAKLSCDSCSKTWSIRRDGLVWSE